VVRWKSGEQFITAKISGLAFKQGSKTHSPLCQSMYNYNFCIKSTSGVGGGGAGGASAPPNILIIWKFGQNPLKFGQNPWKSEQNPQISRKNLWKFGQKWRPMLLYFKQLSPNVCRKTSEDHFLKGHTKKRSAKVAQNFLGQFGKIWAKILCTPKNLIAPTPMKSTNLAKSMRKQLISFSQVIKFLWHIKLKGD